ncbi:septum formation initiator [Actinoplanes sp. TRM 88003]|uniref:Septum formation initiator n=1 Tax=Paractinoplanes aksuensis TaxID=2939490 RepID=A0ABT1DFT2_9ACTN|nr:septum formation initiator [Actinoplanes aksuensis]MCO8269353.1 septum formation initiator [Actinoplanes aksuensis]
MPSVKPPRPVVVAAGWLAAALVATAAGLGGIQLVSDSLTGTRGGVVTEEEVARALAAATPTTAPASSAPSPTPSKRPPRGVFSSAGNTVTVHCEPGDQAYLDSWAPAPGYQVHDYDRGPDDDVEVRFEGSGGRVEFKFHCVGGVPQREQQHGDDDD